jgi:hypothetical protein
MSQTNTNAPHVRGFSALGVNTITEAAQSVKENISFPAIDAHKLSHVSHATSMSVIATDMSPGSVAIQMREVFGCIRALALRANHTNIELQQAKDALQRANLLVAEPESTAMDIEGEEQADWVVPIVALAEAYGAISPEDAAMDLSCKDHSVRCLVT